MKFRAVILNCTLKKSPQVSNTGALIKKVVKHFKMLGVDSEVIRVVDYNIPFGVSSDEGKGDEWPQILKKIKACDIFIIATPIWFGVRGSVAQLVIASPASIVPVILSTFFWFGLLPPILWAISFFYLRQRRLIGWRIFVLGTALALIAALLRPSLLSILFSAIILYFTLQCYDEFSAR